MQELGKEVDINKLEQIRISKLAIHLLNSFSDRFTVFSSSNEQSSYVKAVGRFTVNGESMVSQWVFLGKMEKPLSK